MPKIIKAGKVLTSNSLNAEMILSENTRKQNELDRIANDATRANVVEAIEIEYAPRLTTIESQLVDTVMAVNEIPASPLPRDADRLGGFEASYFAPKASAQMLKLTADDGQPKGYSANANNTIVSGVYTTDVNTLNLPSNIAGSGIIAVYQRSSSYIFQTFFALESSYIRFSTSGSTGWGNWKEIAKIDNAIVESGSNGNGQYVKFGDGTMICLTTIGFGLGNVPQIFNFAATFITGNVSLSTSFAAVPASGDVNVWLDALSKISPLFMETTNFGIVYRGVEDATVAGFINVCAIGRWKA